MYFKKLEKFRGISPKVSKFRDIGLMLPQDPKNLELTLRDVDAKGYLDIELVYRMRQQESSGPVKR